MPEAGQNQLLVSAQLDWKTLKMRTGMLLWQNSHHSVLRKRYPVVWEGLAKACEGNVCTLIVKPLDDLLTNALKQGYFYQRIVCLKAAYDLGQPVGGHARIRGDGNTADKKPVRVGGKLIDIILAV